MQLYLRVTGVWRPAAVDRYPLFWSGSDDNAALYWLARMLKGGEDPAFIARRLVRCGDMSGLSTVSE